MFGTPPNIIHTNVNFFQYKKAAIGEEPER